MPSRALLLYVASVAALVGLLAVGAKLQKVARISVSMEGSAPLSSWFVVVTSDVVFMALWIVAWLWALHLTAGWLRKVVALAMHLTALLALLLLVVEHGFFLSTGALLDWELLAFSASNLEELSKVIASEMGPPTWAAIFSVVGLAFAPWWLLGRRAWLTAAGTWPKAAAIKAGTFAAALLALYFGLGQLSLPNRLQPIRSAAIVDHVSDAAADLLGHESADAVSHIKAVEPLLVTRGTKSERLNLVVIVLESTRALATTPYAPDLKTTPTLANLAKRGTLVETAYAVVPHTTKALVAIHCGTYPKLIHQFVEATPGTLPSDCLPKVLSRQGYATHHMQSPELVFENRTGLATSFGFERITGMKHLPGEGFEEVGYFGYEDKVMVKPALDWIDKQTGPFFLSLLSVVTHHPYEVPSNFPKRDWGVGGKLAEYYDTVAYTDAFLGELFAGFDKRGLLKNTVFVIVGDHGEAFGEHGTYQHDQTPYEEGVRVPLLFLGPGFEAGERVQGLWQSIDILPTLLEALDLRIVAGELPGRSLLSAQPHEELFFSCWQTKRCQALRRGDLKYVHFFNRRPAEVFNLKDDPLEKHNLFAAGKVEPGHVEAAVSKLADWERDIAGRFEAQAQRRRGAFISNRMPEGIQHRTDYVYDDLIRLVGYDIDQTKLNSGDPLQLTYYFEVLKDPGPGWALFMHAVGPKVGDKTERLHGDHVPVGGSHPVAEWKKGQFITDHQWLRVRKDYPSGECELMLGFYNTQNKGRRAKPKGTGAKLTSGRAVHFATLSITNPDSPIPPDLDPRANFTPRQHALIRDKAPADLPMPLTVDFGGLVRLLGVDKTEDQVLAGDSVTWTWAFEVLKQPPRWSEMFIHVIGPRPGSRNYHNAEHVPILGAMPEHKWRKGDFLLDPHTITIPSHFAPGSYDVWFGFWDPNVDHNQHRYEPIGRTDRIDEGDRKVLVGQLQVLPRRRGR